MFDHAIPHLFFEPAMHAQGITVLNEEESGHIIKALRKRIGDTVHTTDGRGMLYTTEIVELQKRNVVLQVVEMRTIAQHPQPEVHIAIAPLKQMDRFEWFLEKAVEIGVTSITPLRTKRTERTILKPERLQKIMVSAMKQSQRMYLPELRTLTDYEVWCKQVTALEHTKMMGWCAEGDTVHAPKSLLQAGQPVQLLIGPEGDLTPEEATLAKKVGFQSISLGAYRLRTETAGVVALAMLLAE